MLNLITSYFIISFRSEAFCSETILDNYNKAVKHCKSGCICSKKHGYVLSNDVWERNVVNLRETRKSYSTKEKDKLLKQDLYNKLKALDFKKVTTHAKLKFDVKLVVDNDGHTKTFTLCERCYTRFNSHICKLFILFCSSFKHIFNYFI